MSAKDCIAACAFFVLFAIAGCRLDDVTRAFSLAEKHAGNVGKATEGFTPEQEHYLGRAVAARIVQKYTALKDDKANSYLNHVGQALALHAQQPFTYGGYHFLLLNSNEVNAFAAPDGLIFVTRGMVALLSGESELAAVLAHEIAHVQNKDAINAIKSSRMTEALLLLGKDAGAGRASVPGGQLLTLFTGSVDDIVNTLVSSGYSRRQEYAADAGAKEILAQAGYSTEALDDVLRIMERRMLPSDSGFGATHPSAADRLSAVKGTGAGRGQEAESLARRFKAALGAYASTAR